MIKKVKKMIYNMQYTNCAKCNKPIIKKTAHKRVSRFAAVQTHVCNVPCGH